jgi:hypothetical protein
MKLYLSKMKQYCMIIAAMLQAFVLCSCANKEWISGRKEQVFDHCVNSMQRDLDKKFAMLNVSSDKLMDSAKLQTKEIDSSTDNFKKLNAKTLKLIKRLKQGGQGYFTKMKVIDKELRNICTADDKIIFKKTFDDVKGMTRKKIQDWKKYSTKVHRLSVEEYTGFFKISTLYKLAELPVKKKMCNPINAKTIQLLNTSVKTIGQKENNLLTINDKLKENMKLQELLYIYNSLRNCRVAANKLTGKGDIQSWYNEESLIVNSAARKWKEKDYFQVLLYNRIMVCDFMIRRLNSPDEYPMELVYFIYQLKLANNYINDETWKKSIDAIISKYIDRFNTINVMSEKNKI